MQEQFRVDSEVTLLFDAELGDIDNHHFSQDYWRDQNRLVGEATGRGTVQFVSVSGGRWVIRHFRRGGLIGRVLRDSYLWTGLQRTRPVREWRLLADLYKLGLPVPRPVAARVVRRGFVYRGDLITEAIPGAQTLAQMMDKGPVIESAWWQVGHTIARFHQAGVWHADLNSHNVLLDEKGDVFLIDFDRGRLRAVNPRWQKANLERLLRSVKKVSKAVDGAVDRIEAGWAALCRGYGLGQQRGGCEQAG